MGTIGINPNNLMDWISISVLLLNRNKIDQFLKRMIRGYETVVVESPWSGANGGQLRIGSQEGFFVFNWMCRASLLPMKQS